MADSNNTTGGIGFFGALTILFIAFKLLNIIDWSWWWVLAPSLIPLAIVGVVLIVVLIILGIGSLENKKKK